MDSNWRVDLGGVPDFCDEEGWTYAHNMTAFADFDALGSKVWWELQPGGTCCTDYG